MSCRWLHDWAPWKTTEVADALHDGAKVGVVLFQQRVCFRCGYTQVDVSTKLI